MTFRSFIENRIPLSEKEWKIIDKLFTRQKIPKGAFILKEGEVCRKLYFLEMGLLRYFIYIKGKEKTKYFTFENYVFTSQQSLNKQTPSKENIQALETSIIHGISYQDLQHIYRTIPQWNDFIKSILREVQSFTEEIMIDQQVETAEDRYRKILDEKPEMIQRIPLKYLASYLGITPESLSRIRKNI